MADANGATAPAAPKAKKPSISDWSKSKLLRTLRLFNMCNGILLITTGILVFLVSALSITFTTVSGRWAALGGVWMDGWEAALRAGCRRRRARQPLLLVLIAARAARCTRAPYSVRPGVVSPLAWSVALKPSSLTRWLSSLSHTQPRAPQVTVSAFVVFFGLLMTCLECNVGSSACAAAGGACGGARRGAHSSHKRTHPLRSLSRLPTASPHPVRCSGPQAARQLWVHVLLCGAHRVHVSSEG
jgi:hypothetical protein